jgi:hypothetical protein
MVTASVEHDVVADTLERSGGWASTHEVKQMSAGWWLNRRNSPWQRLAMATLGHEFE